MAVTDYEKSKLKEFFLACNQMIDGRFILSDVKIQNILSAISNSEILYNLFANCLMDFDYRQEFKKAKSSAKVNGANFVLPDDEKKIIAFVFCLLLDVENGKINLQNFINENFYSADGYNISYKNFAINILLVFKNSVLNELEVDETGELIKSQSKILEENQINMEEVIRESKINSLKEKSKILFAKLLVSLNDLYSTVLRDNKIRLEQKEEVYIIIKGLNEAVRLENLRLINALIIPLEYLIGKNKVVKNSYDIVKENLLEVYSLYN